MCNTECGDIKQGSWGDQQGEVYGYQAQIKIKGKLKHLGYFNTRKQAAVAYDHAVHKHRLPKSRLNFPTMKHNLNKEPKGRKTCKAGSSGFRGVTKRGERYRAMISQLMVNQMPSALSTPKQKQHTPTTEPFSNTTNLSTS